MKMVPLTRCRPKNQSSSFKDTMEKCPIGRNSLVSGCGHLVRTIKTPLSLHMIQSFHKLLEMIAETLFYSLFRRKNQKHSFMVQKK